MLSVLLNWFKTSLRAVSVEQHVPYLHSLSANTSKEEIECNKNTLDYQKGVGY